MSSTLLTEATGEGFSHLQAEQIRRYREAWKEAGHDWTPRVSVSRSIFPIVSEVDRKFFALRGGGWRGGRELAPGAMPPLVSRSACGTPRTASRNWAVWAWATSAPRGAGPPGGADGPPRPAPLPGASRSAPASSTCATRTRSTWPRRSPREDAGADRAAPGRGAGRGEQRDGGGGLAGVVVDAPVGAVDADLVRRDGDLDGLP